MGRRATSCGRARRPAAPPAARGRPPRRRRDRQRWAHTSPGARSRQAPRTRRTRRWRGARRLHRVPRSPAPRCGSSSSSQASIPAGAPRPPSHSLRRRFRCRSARSYADETPVLQRPERDDGLIHEVAALRGITDHHRQIEGTEEHRPHLPAELALAPERALVQLHAARALARDLHLDEGLPFDAPRTPPARTPHRHPRGRAARSSRCSGERSAYRKNMPSSRLVLPSPFGPTTTVSPSGMRSTAVRRWFRKSRSSSHSRCIRVRDSPARQPTAAGSRTGITR